VSPPKKKRGRETTGDMVRSLGLVMVVVVALWFFAQPPDSDARAIRVIDPAPQVQVWTSSVKDAPVPRGLPDGWRATAAYYDPDPDRLRLAQVTPDGEYAEFAASTGPASEVVPELTGPAASRGPVDVDGVDWESYAQEDGSLSLVRTFGEVTVVVGTLRATASMKELAVLAGSVTTAG
jgi:hypothetical protein